MKQPSNAACVKRHRSSKEFSFAIRAAFSPSRRLRQRVAFAMVVGAAGENEVDMQINFVCFAIPFR
jgi:hypothetical protein